MLSESNTSIMSSELLSSAPEFVDFRPAMGEAWPAGTGGAGLREGRLLMLKFLVSGCLLSKQAANLADQSKGQLNSE